MNGNRESIAVKRANLSKVLPKSECYINGHLSHPAFISIAILTFITFVGNFTQLQLSSALPTIVQEFRISFTTGQWLTSIMQLVMGIMVPLTAYLTRLFSTRQIVITSMLIFTSGSVLAWLGNSFPLVLLGRGLEAVGSGVMWPVLQITVFSIFPMSRRGMAMGTVGVAMSVAPALGPTFGGWQTDANGWRSIFLSLAVVGMITLVLAISGLRNFVQNDHSVKADFFSVSLSVIGFGGVMYGFTNIESFSLTSPMVWAPMLIGIVGIVWFVHRQIHNGKKFTQAKTALKKTEGKRSLSIEESSKLRRVQPPLLDLGVLREAGFTMGTICASLSFFAFSSVSVILPLFIQKDRGFDATMSGLVMLPGAFGQLIAQFFGGKILDRFGARPVALVGTITLFVGTVIMSQIDGNTWIWWVSILQFIRQIGMGFVLMPITTWSLNRLEPQEVSAGSAVTNTSRQIAGAIGAPVLVVVMEMTAAARQQILGPGAANAIAANIEGVQFALHISSIIALIMVILVLFGVKGRGAGSTRDVIHRAFARMHRAVTNKSHYTKEQRTKIGSKILNTPGLNPHSRNQ